MKKIFTERRIIVILFISAIVLFSFANQQAHDAGMNGLSVSAAHQNQSPVVVTGSAPEHPGGAARD